MITTIFFKKKDSHYHLQRLVRDLRIDRISSLAIFRASRSKLLHRLFILYDPKNLPLSEMIFSDFANLFRHKSCTSRVDSAGKVTTIG